MSGLTPSGWLASSTLASLRKRVTLTRKGPGIKRVLASRYRLWPWSPSAVGGHSEAQLCLAICWARGNRQMVPGHGWPFRRSTPTSCPPSEAGTEQKHFLSCRSSGAGKHTAFTWGKHKAVQIDISSQFQLPFTSLLLMAWALAGTGRESILPVLGPGSGRLARLGTTAQKAIPRPCQTPQ